MHEMLEQSSSGPQSPVINTQGEVTVNYINGQKVCIPFQCPPRAQHFTGRVEELTQLLHDLQPGRVVTLCGPGGIGKSALAAEAIWTLTQHNHPPEAFPDGIIWYDFYREPQVENALEHIALSFGEELRPTPVDAARRALGGRKALILLDGAEDADNLPKLLEITGSCGVIIASRRQKDAVGERQILEALPNEDAQKLLLAWNKGLSNDKEVCRVCELVGGLPLAVRLVGRYLAETGESISTYRTWLESTPLKALDQGARKLDSAPLLLKRSLRQVSRNARRILAISGILAFAPFSRDVILAASHNGFSFIQSFRWLPSTFRHNDSHHEFNTSQLLNELINYGLLHQEFDYYKISHALIHTYVRQHLRVNRRIVRRIAQYYVKFLWKQLEKDRDDWEMIDEERIQIIWTTKRCKLIEDWETVQKLVEALNPYLSARYLWSEQKTILEIGIEAARRLHNCKGEGQLLSSLGYVFHSFGLSKDATRCFKQALALSRTINDRHTEMLQLQNLGMVSDGLWHREEKLDYLTQALAIAQEIGDSTAEVNLLCQLGSYKYGIESKEKEIQDYKQALIIAKKIGDKKAEISALGRLGNITRVCGQEEESVNYITQELALAREIGDQRAEHYALDGLGLTYENFGQVEEAIDCYKQALIIAKKIENREGEELHLGRLGQAYMKLEQMNQAIEVFEQALAIDREIEYRHGQVNQLSHLESVYDALGQKEKAIEFQKQQITVLQEMGEQERVMTNLSLLGYKYEKLGQIEKGIEYWEQGLAVAKSIGNKEEEKSFLERLVTAHRTLGQKEKEIDFKKQVITVLRETGEQERAMRHLFFLGSEYRELGQIEREIECWEQGLAVAKSIGNKEEEKSFLERLGTAYRTLGQTGKAQHYIQQSKAISKS